MSSHTRGLQNGDRVAVVGGGPAGSFFAIHLLREARRLNRTLEVVIVEKRGVAEPTCAEIQCRGCNFCAGLISPRLNRVLEEHGLIIPDEIIQGRIDYVWIEGEWKNFRLRVPDEMRMYSVFRGSLPGRRAGKPAGFDGYLLAAAVKEGARVVYGEVRKVSYAASEAPTLTIKAHTGADVVLDANFVTIAIGINAHCGRDYRDDPLMESVRQFNPSFVPGRSRKTFIFELDVGEEYLARQLHREIYFIESGSKRFNLEHTALIPKGRFLTVAMIGKVIDEAALPRDSHRIIHTFLTLPQIERILPGIVTAPITCACIPRMTVTTARSPFTDRFAIIGDAAGSRLNKDGLFSAHATASVLAKTVLHVGIDKESLAKGYGKTIEWLAADNRFGRLVFRSSRMAFTHPFISRIIYQAFATEYKERDESNRPVTAVLWKIASGTADYREVFREMRGDGVLRSILFGAAVTLRNVAFESLLGLKWGEYGRYPTVVLKEKREVLKNDLARSLGKPFHNPSDFERMYAIKIRASAERIMQALARFGRPDSGFVNLRFVKVRQTQGIPNEIGSVIQYKIPLLWFRPKMRLTNKVGSETLLYKVDGHLVDHGELIFNVTPTKDGNRRLAIYTSFDYKRGKGFGSEWGWRVARWLFPEFVHDIVWNHALCSIKEEVERTRRPQTPIGLPRESQY